MASELYLLEVHGVHAGEYTQNNLYFKGNNLNAGDVIVNARDLLSNWNNNAQGLWNNLLPATYQTTRVTARRIDVAGGITIVDQFQAGQQPGNVSGGASSEQLCPIIRLIPPNGVKSAGRFFLPAMPESMIGNNTPTAGWSTAVANLMGVLITGMNDGSIEWFIAVYSRKLNQYHEASDFDTSPIIGWQMRRKRPA